MIHHYRHNFFTIIDKSKIFFKNFDLRKPNKQPSNEMKSPACQRRNHFKLFSNCDFERIKIFAQNYIIAVIFLLY